MSAKPADGNTITRKPNFLTKCARRNASATGGRISPTARHGRLLSRALRARRRWPPRQRAAKERATDAPARHAAASDRRQDSRCANAADVGNSREAPPRALTSMHPRRSGTDRFPGSSPPYRNHLQPCLPMAAFDCSVAPRDRTFVRVGRCYRSKRTNCARSQERAVALVQKGALNSPT